MQLVAGILLGVVTFYGLLMLVVLVAWAIIGKGEDR